MQLSLIELLKEFPVTTVAQYHKLPPREQANLRSRLYESLALDAKNVLERLKTAGGLKLHFNVTHSLERGCENIPSATFLRKAAFFANQTVITFPYDRSSGDSRTLNDLLPLLWDLRPFLELGLVSVIPSDLGAGKVKPGSFFKKYELTSANFHLQKLQLQFEEPGISDRANNCLIVSQIFLPYFTNVETADVIKIRDEENMIYRDFENELFRRLSTGDGDTEEKFLDELGAIHKGIEKLDDAFRNFQDHVAQQRWDSLVHVAKKRVGLVMLLSKDARAGFIDYLRNQPDHTELLQSVSFPGIDSHKDWELEETYLLWRVHASAKPRA